jgi:3-keto-5-aminohexanoate cleavage enzyme
MVTAIGRHNFPIMAVAMALGGHVRTGVEDVVYTAPGEYAPSNAALVERAVALADAIGRPAATPTQAREIFGINRLQRDPALNFSSMLPEPGGLG